MSDDLPGPIGRRAVEFSRCEKGHRWTRVRDASGWINKVCDECGGPAVRSVVQTCLAYKVPDDWFEGDGDEPPQGE